MGFDPTSSARTGRFWRLLPRPPSGSTRAFRSRGCITAISAQKKPPEIVTEINESKADCLFIGMPTPQKERFLSANRVELSTPFVMGVGGSFDVMAGNVSRAPLLFQRRGLEWLFRVLQEPRRLFWRYAETNSWFLFLLTRELLVRLISAKRGTSRAGRHERAQGTP